MRWFNLVLACSVLAVTQLAAQVPQAIKYQTIVRDSEGNLMANETLSFQITILDSAGNSVYREIQNNATNSQGLISFNIGEGIIQAGVFDQIPWGRGEMKLRVELDHDKNGIYGPDELMGTSELLSVPYALVAERVRNPGGYHDGDGIRITGEVIHNTGDLDSTNELQTLSISANTLSISGGNSITLPGLSQTLTLSGDTLSLYHGSSVNLSSYLDNTDNQSLSSVTFGDSITINISNGSGTSFSMGRARMWDTVATGDVVMVDTTENVGIGTKNPLYKLDVHGDARITSLTGTGSRVLVANAAGMITAVPYDTVSVEWKITGEDVYLLNNTTSVGIGISAPIAKLHVKGTDTLNASNAFVISDHNNVPLFKVKNDGSVQIGNYDEPNIRLQNLDSAGVFGDFVTMQNNGNEFFNISMEDGYFAIGDLSGASAGNYIMTNRHPFQMDIFNFDQQTESGVLNIYSNITQIGDVAGLENMLIVNDQAGEIELRTDAVKLNTNAVYINNTPGFSGTFQTLTGDVVTVMHGIIISVTPP